MGAACPWEPPLQEQPRAAESSPARPPGRLHAHVQLMPGTYSRIRSLLRRRGRRGRAASNCSSSGFQLKHYRSPRNRGAAWAVFKIPPFLRDRVFTAYFTQQRPSRSSSSFSPGLNKNLRDLSPWSSQESLGRAGVGGRALTAWALRRYK